MAPLSLATTGTIGQMLIFGAIGFGFGAALEMGGFGDTRKLAAQFYLRDMTVLKVMFTAIIVAATLLALATSFGFLDMNRVWVNPTFLGSEIVGGLIMGVGFVIGGFCPGTSLVAAATLKIDGMFFLLGGLLGVWLFGESVSSFESFWLSSSMGRFTLPEWLGLSTGVVVLLVVVMALFMFVGGEWLEQRFGGVVAPKGRKVEQAGAFALLAASVVLVVRADPTTAQRWQWASPELRKQVDDRSLFASPAEVVLLRKDTSVEVNVIDLRDEHDFNLFHIGGARRLSAADLERPAVVKPLIEKPATSVTFLVGNGEASALAAWQGLKARGVPNLYVIEGGINRWLALYPAPSCVAQPDPASLGGQEKLAYRFAFATGSRLPAAWPELPHSKEFRSPCPIEPPPGAETAEHGVVWPDHPFTKRVKLQVKSVVKGGCG